MKILVLNPAWTAGHQMNQALAKRGISVLQASTAEEAWLLLQMQGQAIDLAVINRELRRVRSAPASPPGTVNDGGLAFYNHLRRSPEHGTIPVLLTSELWGPADYLNHQKSSARAAAYLALPCTEQQLIDVIARFAKPATPVFEAPAAVPVAPTVAAPVAPWTVSQHHISAPPVYPSATTMLSVSGSNEDYEVLRMYLMLREKDVAILTAQLKEATRELGETKQRYRHERMKNVELEYRLEQEQQRAKELEKENSRLNEQLQDEIEIGRLRRQLEGKAVGAAVATCPEPQPTPRQPEPELPESFEEDKSMFILKSKSSATN